MELEEEVVAQKIKAILSKFASEVVPQFIEASHSTCIPLHTLNKVVRDISHLSIKGNETLPFVLDDHTEIIPLRIRVREYSTCGGEEEEEDFTVKLTATVDKTLEQIMQEDSAPPRFGDMIDMMKKLSVGPQHTKFSLQLQSTGGSNQWEGVSGATDDCIFEVENVTSLFLKNFASFNASTLNSYILDLPQTLNEQLREATNPSNVPGLEKSRKLDKREWIFLPKDHVLCYCMYLHSKGDDEEEDSYNSLGKHEQGFFLEREELSLLQEMFAESIYTPMIKRYVHWVAPHAVKLQTRCRDNQKSVNLKIAFTYIVNADQPSHNILNNSNVLPTLDPLLIEQLRQGDFLKN